MGLIEVLYMCEATHIIGISSKVFSVSTPARSKGFPPISPSGTSALPEGRNCQSKKVLFLLQPALGTKHVKRPEMLSNNAISLLLYRLEPPPLVIASVDVVAMETIVSTPGSTFCTTIQKCPLVAWAVLGRTMTKLSHSVTVNTLFAHPTF
jgi:hypothetical protein